MTSPGEAERAGWLRPVLQCLTECAPGGLAAQFTEELFSKVDAGEFEAYDPASLAALAANAFETFRTRPAGAPKVVFRDCVLNGTAFLVVDIVNADMPFLLDSVAGELRARGLAPELIAHPIFEVHRTEDGGLVSLTPARVIANGAPRESFIHLQIRKSKPLPPDGEIAAAIQRALAETAAVVSDFGAMTARLKQAIRDYQENPPPAPPEINAEAIEFLNWLADGNFLFLGSREYTYMDSGKLIPEWETGLGLLRESGTLLLASGPAQSPLAPQIHAYFLNSPPVIAAKGNSKSTVHRRGRMDIVGIKLYGAQGKIVGHLRFAGLFAGLTCNHRMREIPLLRQKVRAVLDGAGFTPGSHSERALLYVLETFPRDELFQTPVEQLARIAGEIVKTELNPRPRVFLRRDEFERFVSAFVYVPRERYNTEVRVAIVKALEEATGGTLDSCTPFFSEGAMVRVHFAIWRGEETLKEASEEALERQVEKIVRTWGDELLERIIVQYGSAGYKLAEKYLRAFPAGYQAANRPSRAVQDIACLEKLMGSVSTGIDIHREDITGADDGAVRATLLQVDKPVALSARVPVFENLGFDVVSEQTFEITPSLEGGGTGLVYLHDTRLRLTNGGKAALFARKKNLEDGFLAVWSGAAANDRFNGLILSAGLSWRQVALLRAYGAYYRQTGTPHGMDYVAEVLNRHARIATDLCELFSWMFCPDSGLDAPAREAGRAKAALRITGALDKIPVLDEDRILRNLLALINATLRTNFYQPCGREAEQADTIAFKLRSGEIDWLPAPKPFAEIFVYSPRFEAIHLRGGPVARGGLRWSDRPQDFRTEVLGLAKAQQVKNAVIVPQGAKGGFVPRKLPPGREAAQAEAVACYRAFIASLLSLTDNLSGGKTVPPEHTVCRDGGDAYLVVAADKGTATFSDIANGIALSRGFWLGDAFASGGSAGYDHKAMGITAKGAWEAVKRHFREMNVDIQATPFTVAGVGDMSGDVFGNAMLQSRAIKLVAAFDHRDIFIDPAPDPAASFEERQRLFHLPRSSWQDYDRAKISQGGGVFSRSEKYIALSPEARALLGLGAQATPAEIMGAIIKAPVDLLWFGGIGTYVRGSGETDAQVNDKANDAIRAAAKEIQAKVIGEGANLAVTQRGRIEFALLGGRLNTDAIDNSAGVNTSDAEVNIKIALGAAVSSGKLDKPARDTLLAAMTEDVAESVLHNNYLQTLSISLAEQDGIADLGFQQQLIQQLETRQHLNRALESLPSDAAIAERSAANRPLTRPELAVLLAYAKIDLKRSLIDSAVPDDPHLRRVLMAYFPSLMREQFAEEIAHHPLRREIVATSLANEIVDSGGPTFIVRLAAETGAEPEDIAYSFAAVMAVHNVARLYAGIDALDGRIDGQIQLKLYLKVQDLLRNQTAWFLRHGLSEDSLDPEIGRYREGMERLAANLTGALPEEARSRLENERERLLADGVPPPLAMRLASLEPLAHGADAVRVAGTMKVPVEQAARTIFAIRNAFHLDELAAASDALAAGGYYDRLAVNSSLAAVASAQRALARRVIEHPAAHGDFAVWNAHNEGLAGRVAQTLAGMLEGHGLTLAKLMVGVAQLRDLAAI